jgi:hypothetical protein
MDDESIKRPSHVGTGAFMCPTSMVMMIATRLPKMHLSAITIGPRMAAKTG